MFKNNNWFNKPKYNINDYVVGLFKVKKSTNYPNDPYATIEITFAKQTFKITKSGFLTNNNEIISLKHFNDTRKATQQEIEDFNKELIINTVTEIINDV